MVGDSRLRDYIEQRCVPVPFCGCWMWLLSAGSHGYGQATLGKTERVTTAHRVSYLAFKGEIPEGMLIQHSCDTRWCVNPDHLSLGTDKSNADDKIDKGRGGYEYRRNPPQKTRKLTADQVRAIRIDGRKQRDIANDYGVHQRVVWAIKNGLTYKEV